MSLMSIPMSNASNVIATAKMASLNASILEVSFSIGWQLAVDACLPAGRRQLPTVNCQLSTANCQLSTANCQLSTANCQLLQRLINTLHNIPSHIQRTKPGTFLGIYPVGKKDKNNLFSRICPNAGSSKTRMSECGGRCGSAGIRFFPCCIFFFRFVESDTPAAEITVISREIFDGFFFKVLMSADVSAIHQHLHDHRQVIGITEESGMA